MKSVLSYFYIYLISLGLFSINILSADSLTDGIDWSLPSYASASTNGGFIGEEYNTDPEITAIGMIVVWRLIEIRKNEFNWSNFDEVLNDTPSKKVVVRLEVNSACHAPKWANLPSLDNKTLQFWKPAYQTALKRFVDAFAKRYSNNHRLVGVYLGIGDGEYYQDTNDDGDYDSSNCPTNNDYDSLVYGNGRDGWGEFWVDHEYGEDKQSLENGLTPSNFEASTKRIIDIYTDAFGINSNKLAFVGLDSSFGISSMDARLPSINEYAKAKGVGNRSGQIEDWMRYTGNRFGVGIKTASNADQSCSLTFDEKYADRIAKKNLYWGDENEFYGPKSWVTDDVGPISNQPYRFFMSSLRALQLRKNYITINEDGIDLLRNNNNQTEFRSKDFIAYLTKTYGRTRKDTPDAFVLLGEKTMSISAGKFPKEYQAENSTEQCLISGKQRGYVKVDQFGRWLSVISPTKVDKRIRRNMPESEGHWGIQHLISDRGNNDFHELYARKSNEFLFDINDQLIEDRCKKGCNIDIKVSFKDDHVMELQVIHAKGQSEIMFTKGGGKTRTATFTINSTFSNSLKKADFALKTFDGSEVSILITRINFNQNYQ